MGQNLRRAQINVGNVHGSSRLRSLNMSAPLIVHAGRLDAPCQVYNWLRFRHAQIIGTVYDIVMLSCVGMGWARVFFFYAQSVGPLYDNDALPRRCGCDPELRRYVVRIFSMRRV